MHHTLQDLYKEMVAMKTDLEEHLNNNDLSPHVKQLAEEELLDLIATIEKIESGGYGFCEETGYPIPGELLLFQPTVRSLSEVKTLMKFFRKPVFPL